MVGNSALARLHVVVHAEPGKPLATVDEAELQAKVAARGPVLGRGPGRGGGAQAWTGTRRHHAVDLCGRHP